MIKRTTIYTFTGIFTVIGAALGLLISIIFFINIPLSLITGALVMGGLSCLIYYLLSKNIK